MNKEILEKYIQFALDSFLNLDEVKEIKFYNLEIITETEISLNYKNWDIWWKSNFIALITSCWFINAIARGVLKNNNWGWWWYFLFNEITHNQADAIRDDKLEEFILSLNI